MMPLNDGTGYRPLAAPFDEKDPPQGGSGAVWSRKVAMPEEQQVECLRELTAFVQEQTALMHKIVGLLDDIKAKRNDDSGRDVFIQAKGPKG